MLENSFLNKKENNPRIANEFPQHLESQFYHPFISEESQFGNDFMGCQSFGSNLNSFMSLPPHPGFWNANDGYPFHSLFYNGQNVISNMYWNENLALKQGQNNES